MSIKTIIILIGILFVILVSIQYTLNLILRELRQLRISCERSELSRLNRAGRDFEQ